MSSLNDTFRVWKGDSQDSQDDISKATGHFERCFQREYPNQDIYKNSVSIKKLKVQGLPYVGRYSVFPKTVWKPLSLFYYYYDNFTC